MLCRVIAVGLGVSLKINYISFKFDVTIHICKGDKIKINDF